MRTVYEIPPGALAAGSPAYFGQAAIGPDYGTGNAPPPKVGSAYRPPLVVVIPENYAENGAPDPRQIKGQRSIWLEAGPLTFPTYNDASPQGIYGLQVITAQQYAIWETNNPTAPTPIPVDFQPGGPVTLYGGA